MMLQIKRFSFALSFFLSAQFSYAVDFYDNSIHAPHIGLIQSARSQIDIETYTMADPLILQAISTAQDRGVKVRIVQEPSPVGVSCKVFGSNTGNDPAGCSDLRNFVARVISKGGEYVPYNKDVFCKGSKICYEHGKMMIFDKKIALVSTGNFDATSICDISGGASRCNRDYSIVTKDPGEVKALETVFEHDLSGQLYDLKALVDQLPSNTLTVSPYSLEPLIAFIRSAKNSIQVQNQYLKDPDLNRELQDAASKRHVKVQVMVSSICSFGRPSANEVSKVLAVAGDFQNAGVEARVFTKRIQVNGQQGYLHAKTIVVDHHSAWVGSVNGSTTALATNREYGVFFQDAAAVSQLNSIIDSDFANSGSTSLTEDAHCGGL